MMRIADFIADYLSENGITDVFMIVGGGAMHLNDAFGRHPKMNYTCCHHEQACAMAAEGYYRASGKIAAVNVTTGPGGTNTITGLAGQFHDSIPAIYISGQVKYETTILSCPELGLRQLGDQEIDIISIVKPLTKYSKVINDAKSVKNELHKAITIAKSGRPGPVWLDIPLNIQGAMISEEDFYELETIENSDQFSKERTEEQIDELTTLLSKAKRPVIVAGHGIRISRAIPELRNLIEQYHIPTVTTFNGYDLLEEGHPQYIGRIGTLGTRAGNFCLQNSDLLITIGTRNNIRQVSYNWENLAREATKVVVDIDSRELKKKTLVPDLPIHSDAKYFLQTLIKKLSNVPENINIDFKEYLEWSLERKAKYPSVLPEYHDFKETIHPYPFLQSFSKNLPKNSTVVAGNGSACVVLFQAGYVNKDQRSFWNSGCATMGYAVPAAVGASIADKSKTVYCLTGDGSIMMNLQELQTIIHLNLPVKVILLYNDGYQSIKQTQNNFFKGNIVGCSGESGVGFPDFYELSKTLGFKTYKVEKPEEVESNLEKFYDHQGPAFLVVNLDLHYTFQPKLSSKKNPDGSMVSKPLEDLFPFQEREEFMKNMIVKPLLED